MDDSTTFLSNAIICDSFELNAFNLIVAPCGSGKTTAAFSTIPDYLHVTPNRCLVLVNTRSAADSFVEEDKGYFFNFNGKEWDAHFQPQYDKPTIMTYANFGARIKKKELVIGSYDYLVCDEIHTLNQYISISRAKLKKNYPQATPWEINDMLQVTCFTYIALESIVQAVKDGTTWVFGMTATPAQLYKSDLSKLGAIVNEVQFSQKLHAYENLCKFEYSEIEPILQDLVPENRKRLFFFNTIKELKSYKQILLDCGRAAEALWSVAATEPMDEHQLTTRDYVLQEHRFPDDVQDLLINGAYETAINIKDPLVQEVYIHTGNKDTQVQARNRLRQNIEKVGYYNKHLHYQDKHNLKNKTNAQHLISVTVQNIVDLPSDFIGRPLTTEDKNQLITILHFPKKWTTLKKVLIEAGWIVTDKSSHGMRYTIITSNEKSNENDQL